MQSSRIDCEFSGSTAVVGFLRGRTLATAWVGDSRCVMGKQPVKGGPFEAVDMTKDHKPTLPEEKARIQASNGRVERYLVVPEMATALHHRGLHGSLHGKLVLASTGKMAWLFEWPY